MQNALRGFFLVSIFVVGFGGCAPSSQTSDDDIIEQLYFGRNDRGVLVVSDSAWGVFLSAVVTPRFPTGFTVWRTEGQWRDSTGVIEREPGFVLEHVHPNGVHVESAMRDIIAEYKRRFRQESVLRVTFRGRAAF